MYLGSAVGGAVGGVLTLYAGPVVGAMAGASLGTFAGMGLEKWTGKEDHSWGSIIGMTFLSAGIAGLTAGLTKGINISGITSGRGSWSSVYKAMVTTVRHGFKDSIIYSAKVVVRGAFANLITGFSLGFLFENAAKGLIDAQIIFLTRWRQQQEEYYRRYYEPAFVPLPEFIG